jgi:hypothetical protein
MRRIESIKRTPSRGHPAGLNEARRALVNLALRSVVFGSCIGGLDLVTTQVEMASDAQASLDAAATASLAGRLFVVDYPTLVDDLDSVLDAIRGRIIQPPFDVTPIFMPGFVEGSCPLFIVTREATGLFNLMTAIPMKNDETFSWVVPGFPADCEELAYQIVTGLLAAINAHDLKPIGAPK